MGEFINEDHNEAVDVETSLGDALNILTDLSNRLYARHGVNHPMQEEVQSVIAVLESIPWDDHYEALEREAGEDSWWAEA